MRIVNGTRVRQMDAADVAAWAARFQHVIIDLGAGDGRYVRRLAHHHPERGAIAVDLCEANMRRASRVDGGNALFVVADALALPNELQDVATRITLNFPWGSLLRGLVDGHAGLVAGLPAIGLDGATLEIVLNDDAMTSAGCSLETGSGRVLSALRHAGFGIGAVSLLGPTELRQVPTTWAKRLAFGRAPRAVRIAATLAERTERPMADFPGARQRA